MSWKFILRKGKKEEYVESDLFDKDGNLKNLGVPRKPKRKTRSRKGGIPKLPTKEFKHNLVHEKRMKDFHGHSKTKVLDTDEPDPDSLEAEEEAGDYGFEEEED